MTGLAFLIAIAWLPITSAVSTPRWILVQVGGAALLLSTRYITMTPAHWWGLAFLTICSASAIWSPSPADSVGRLVQLLGLAAVFCVAAEVRDLGDFWLALAAGVAVNAVIALVQLYGWQAFMMVPDQRDYPMGLFGNKNFLAQLAALALVGGIITALKPHFNYPIFTFAMIAWCAVVLWLTGSRGAGLAVAGALAAWYWRMLGLNWWAFWSLAFPVAVALIAADLVLNPTRMATSVSPRLGMWDWTVTNLRPFGWGIGAFGSIFPFEHAFNDALEFAFELGIGMLPLAMVLIYALRAPPYAPGEGYDAEWAVLVALVIMALVAFPFQQAATAFVGAVVAGRLAGARYRACSREPGGRVIRSPSLAIDRYQPF